MSPGRDIKTGVASGQPAVPPHYKWSVLYFDVARKEALEVLHSEEAYHHIADQFKELALEDDPTHSLLVDVKKLKNEDFYELRDKGGPLGKTSFRAFFLIDKKHGETGSIVVLGAISKTTDGQTPMVDIVRMRRRRRDYERQIHA